MVQLVPCEACGAQLSPAAASCPHCGHPRVAQPAPPQYAQPAPPQYGSPYQYPPQPMVVAQPPHVAYHAQAQLHEAQADYYRVQTWQAAQNMLQPKQSPMAIIALACTLGGLLSSVVIYIGAVIPIIIGIVLGRMALKEIQASQGRLTGAQAAQAAVLIGYCILGLGALGVALLIGALAIGAVK